MHALAPAPVGGLEEVVRSLASGQSARGHNVHASLAVTDARHPFVERLGQEPIAVHPLVMGSRQYRRERRAFEALCRELRPDIVHTHGYRSDVVDGRVAQRLDIPLLSTVHGFTGGDWKNRLYERVQVHRLKSFNAVVAVSRALEQDLLHRGVPPRRLWVIRNAIGEASPLSREEACRRLGVRCDGYNIGWVGRLGAEKGIDLFVEALALLGDRDATGVVVGDGPLRASMEARVAKERLSVTFRGSVPEAAGLFRAFDVFVLSSRTEGTPVVLLEAIAAGVPVIGTRVGGVPDVFNEAEGVLVAAEDPQALAQAMRGVRTDPAAARERAKAALERHKRDFSLSTWLDQYDALYRRLIGEAGG